MQWRTQPGHLGKHQRVNLEALSLVALCGRAREKACPWGRSCLSRLRARVGEVVAGVGRVRSLAILSIRQEFSSLALDIETVEALQFFPQEA